MTDDVQTITATLDPMRSALLLDGYDLRVVEAGPSLRVRIDALEDACEDCLAPPGVMSGILSAALGGAYPPDRIAIEYPPGSAAAGR
jgi:hypothetical protein